MILAALILSVPAQLPDVKLNYTTVAVPLSRICEDLSKQTGVRLRVTDDLAGEPVVIRFADVPAKEGLDKIASTIRAEWVTSQEGMLLTRTQRLQQKLEEEEYEIKVADIATSQDRFLRATDASFSADKAQELATEIGALSLLDPERRRGRDFSLALRALQAKTPFRRFLLGVYRSFSPETLAQLPEAERVVFSSRPTRVQRPLQLSEEVLHKLVDEQEVFVRALASTQVKEENLYGIVTKQLPQDAQVLVTTEEGSLNIYLFDAEYNVLASESVSFAWDSSLTAREAERLLPSEEPIKLGPLVQEIVDRTNMTMGDMQPRGELSAQAREVLLTPERYDPLLGFSELLLKTAERDGVNVVAYAPDIAAQFSYGLLMRESKLPARAFLQLNRLRDLRIDQSESWLTCSARFPLAILGSRLPRTALGAYIREVDRQGFVSLANAAAFIGPFSDRKVRDLGWYYTTMLRGKQDVTPLDQPQLIRFYGSLSQPQFQAFSSGAKLGLADFSPVQTEMIEKLVYSGPLQPNKPMYSSDEYDRWGESLRHEATFALGDGLPEGTQVELSIKDRELYVMRSKHGPDEFPHDRSVSLSGIATFFAQGQRTDLFPFASGFEVLSLVPSRVVSLRLTVYPSDAYRTGLSFEEQRPLGPSVTFRQFLDQMSDEQRNEWQQLVAKANENFKKLPAEARQPQAVPPPPPPSQ